MKNVLIFFVIILTIYAAYRIYKYQTLDQGLDSLIKNGAIILDVRTEKEYETGHIAGSQNISLGTIRERYTELDPNKTYYRLFPRFKKRKSGEYLKRKRV